MGFKKVVSRIGIFMHHNDYIVPILSKIMELLIMGLRDAVGYKPSKPTYAIRIQSGILRYVHPLQSSTLYTLREYTF